MPKKKKRERERIKVLNVKTKQKPEIKGAFDGLINRLYTWKERINALVKICQQKFPKQK